MPILPLQARSGARRTAAAQRQAMSTGIDAMADHLRQITGHTLTEAQKVIPEGMRFREWCEKLGADGMKVDGKPFKLDDRPAMAWIYDQIPATYDEAYNLTLVLMKCAQVGFTVMEMLAMIYLGLRFGPAFVGMFLPSQQLATVKSTLRFVPIVRSVPAVHDLMVQESSEGKGHVKGEGNVFTRQISDAKFVFSWTSSRSLTESIPMELLSFDEVQEMSIAQMEKTKERLSASRVRFTLMGSTAKWPDSDIHHWYKLGSQHRFHTECPTCRRKKPLDEYFPECIRFDPELEIYRYVCEAPAAGGCGGWIEDPQIGEWIPENPDADPLIRYDLERRHRPERIRSIHFPQFLSPTISAGEIISSYTSATDMQNFFNRKLGKPYLDPSQVPVTLEHLAKCVEAGREVVVGKDEAGQPIKGLRWKSRARHTFMGIDQMGNFNVHVIKERLPDGRQAVVHVEETYSDDPFMRSSELMELFGVQVCVVEINPNYNDAKRFANRHEGRVFICNSFGTLEEDMIRWGDAGKMSGSDRKTADEERDRYTLRMDQFKCMQVSMARFTAKDPMCLFPDPQGLVQEVVDKGVRQTVPVLPRMFTHLTKTALVAEKVKAPGETEAMTNRYRRVVRKIAIDPHFSYANMLCDVAWARAYGTGTFMIPDVGAGGAEQMAKTERMNMPGLPTAVARMIDDEPTGEDRCGNCSAFDPDTRQCIERGIIVAEADPACPFHVRA